MRLAVVLLLVALVLLPASDSLFGRRRRRWFPRFRIRIRVPKIARFLDKVGKIVGVGKAIVGAISGKRDVEQVDLNNDGIIDESEAEKIFERRDVQEVLALADEDGDSKVSVAEFQEVLQQLTQRAIDDDVLMEDNAEI